MPKIGEHVKKSRELKQVMNELEAKLLKKYGKKGVIQWREKER